MVYVTAGLLDGILHLAADREPAQVSIRLFTTPAAEFYALPHPADTPIFTHFYLPDVGESLTATFGMDLGTPTGRTQGRFVSHPDSTQRLETTDDLGQIVLVAVPPWDRESVAAYNRKGERLPLDIVDAEPPVETLED